MQTLNRLTIFSISLITLSVISGIIHHVPSAAQTRKKTLFVCSYGERNHGAEYCEYRQKNPFASNQHAERAVDMILKPLGLKRNFVLLPCPNIKNAEAVILRDGNRYIVYDNAFMEAIDSRANTDWASVSILAHEIGHHLNGHTTQLVNDPPTKEDYRQSRMNELEADEFSGFVMFKLGRTLGEARAAINNLRDVTNEEYSTHPQKWRRLEAIKKGYEDARSQAASTSREESSTALEETMTRLVTILRDKTRSGGIFVGHIAIVWSASTSYRVNGCTLSVNAYDEELVIPFSNINPLSIKGYKVVNPPVEGSFRWMVDMQSYNASFKRVANNMKQRVAFSSEASFEFYRPEAQTEFIRYAERAVRLCGGTGR